MNVLNVKALTKTYSKNTGIINLDLEVEKNDVILLLGPNGAGKTTAFRGILGLIEANFDKKEIMEKTLNTKQLKKVGAMVSKPAFYDYLSGYDHLKICELMYDNVDEYRIDQVLNEVGLINAKHKKVAFYSTGMKQRLDLARAIIHQPNLLLLDEPFSGMDIEAKHDLKILLKNLQSNGHTGILISSHMVGDLESFANKIIIIYEGKTLYSGHMTTIASTGLTLEEFYLQKIEMYKKGA